MDENNGRIMRHVFEEVITLGNLDIIDKFFAGDFAGHDTAGEMFGREEFRQGVIAMLDSFSDRHVVIADQLVAGEKVATRWHATAVHSADFHGIPPTGRRVSMTGISINRLVDGKIVESWEVTDDAGLLRQIGVPLGV